MVGSQVLELRAERVDVEVDLTVRSPPDTVVDEHRDAVGGLHEAVAVDEHLLHERPGVHPTSVAPDESSESPPGGTVKISSRFLTNLPIAN